MKEKLLCFLLLGFMLIGSANAQDRRISGKVTDAADGSPLEGVTVQVTGTAVVTSTDGSGNYSITVSGSSPTLTFSMLGMESRTVAVGATNVVNVTLTAASSLIDEVVVNMGYVQQAKREVTGSITKITAESFENQAVTNFQQAIQGRAAGVQVTSNTGIPGGSVSINVRGIGSFSAGTQPLYIIDGVQMNGATFGGYTQTSTLAGLNPNDIESIEIIKDAATASIYGAQAANGVVLITTKKGAAGSTKVSVNAYTGYNEINKFYNVLNTQEYITLRTEAWTNANPRASAAAIRNTMMNEIRQPATTTDEELAMLPTTDWQREAFGTGRVQNYELGVSGGTEKTQFYVSGNYSYQKAIVSKSDFQRLGSKITLDHNVNNKLTFGVNLNLANMQQGIPFGIDGSTFGNPAFSSSLMLPTIPVRNEDGTYYGMPGSGQTIPGLLNHNIIAVTEYNSGKQATTQIVGSAYGNYKITPSLSFRSFFSMEYANLLGKSYRDPRTPDGMTHNGLLQTFTNHRSNFMTNQMLSYNKIIDDHKIDALLAFEYRFDDSRTLQASGRGFPSYLFRNLGAAAEPYAVSESWGGFKRSGYLGRVSYGYKGRYIVSANLRYDGSSRFGSNNLWGWFPGVSVAWNVADESFMDNAPWVSDLKLRVGYGQGGNDNIGNFAARALYSRVGVYQGQPAIAPSNLANPDLRWEKSSTTDIAVDYSFFRNRLFGSLGVFRRISSDLLMSQPLISTSGFTSITTNVGKLQNEGIEFEVNSVNVQTEGGFRWGTNFNFTYIENEILELYGGHQQLPTDVNMRVGHAYGAVFTYQFAGVSPATGRPMIWDANDNLAYVPVAADRRYIGQTRPKYTGGFSNDFSFKGFDLSVLFQYQYGGISQDGQAQFLSEVGNRAFNALKEDFDARWTTPGQVTHIARPYNGGTEPNGVSRLVGSALYFNTDMIRLKNIQAGYTFPSSLLNRINVESLRVYFQANNPYTYTEYRGYDPEFGSTATGIIPQAKNYTFGLQLGF